MEFSRRFHRIPVSYDAFLLAHDINLPCFIENISEGGLNIMITARSSEGLTTGEFVKLQFKIPVDEEYELIEREILITCEIVWIRKKAEKGMSLGLRVVDENISYQNFVKALYMKKAGIL